MTRTSGAFMLLIADPRQSAEMRNGLVPFKDEDIVDDNRPRFEGLAGSDNTILTPMVNFIAKELAKVIDPLQPEPIVAIAETAERINDTRWFWVDDTAKTAELFAVPNVRDAYPALADATLDY